MKKFACVSCLVVMGLLMLSSCKKGSDSSPLKVQVVKLPAQLPESLNAICFLDEANGFVGGSNGGIYKTTNSGKSWTAVTSGVSAPIYSIFFVNKLEGFAAGGESSCGGTGCTPTGGFILRTQNGGQTWVKVYTPTAKVAIDGIYFTSASTGFCIGITTIYKTTDGGSTWSEYPFENLGGKMMKVKFADAKNGFVVCLSDKIIKTTDGGATWQVTNPGFNLGYYDLALAGGTVYTVGQGKVIKSTNNGSSWTLLNNAPEDIFSAYFLNNNQGIVFGRGKYSGGDFGYSYASMYITHDGGTTWQGSDDIMDYGLIQSLSFPDNSSMGYAVNGNQVFAITLK